MRITRVEVIPFRLPYRQVFRIATGAMSAKDGLIVRIHSDEGLVGVGEGNPQPTWPRGLTQRALVAIIEDEFAPRLVGQDPRAIGRLVERLDRSVAECPFALAPVDLALHDLAGKALELPVSDLLGGARRTEVDLHFTIGIQAPEAMAAAALAAWERGFRAFKVKVGGPDFTTERQMLQVIRDALPEARLRVDANQGWHSDQAVRNIRALEPLGLELVEQPVPAWDLDGLAKVTAAVDVPIMADESLFSPSDAVRLVRMQACDIFNIKLMKSGGLWNAGKIAAIAEAAGISCFMGSMADLEVGIAAALHFIASHPVIRYPFGFPEFAETSLLLDPLVPSGGKIEVPDRPGLGVELDMDKVNHYRLR